MKSNCVVGKVEVLMDLKEVASQKLLHWASFLLGMGSVDSALPNLLSN